MTDVVPLHVPGRPVDPDIVDRLRTLLEMAERGEVIAVAICTVNVRRESATTFVIGDQFAPLVSSLATLQHRLMMDAYGD